MKAVVQRVLRARVTVDEAVVGEIAHGLVVFLGVAPADSEATAAALARRIVAARVFSDDDGRMNRSLADVAGSMLVVSQFTLLGDTNQRRPYFGAAAPPAQADALYQHFVACARASGTTVATGRFGAHMLIDSVNDGPVTLLYKES